MTTHTGNLEFTGSAPNLTQLTTVRNGSTGAFTFTGGFGALSGTITEIAAAVIRTGGDGNDAAEYGANITITR